MSPTVDTATSGAIPSRAARRTGRVLTGLIAAFLFFDAIGKLVPVAPVVEAMEKLGFAHGTIRPIGALLAVSTALHLWPRTQFVGAVLLTAYLGGATVTHVHAGTPFWFSVVMGVLLWVAYVLRQPRLRSFLR